MKRDSLIKIAKLFGDKYKFTGRWVMCSCPVARYTHPDGDDKRFSFGICETGGFHCFTCGIKGFITQLPRLIARYTHEPPFKVEAIIKEILEENEVNIEQIMKKKIELKKIPYCLDERILKNFENPQRRILGMNEKDYEKWEIKQDGNKLIFPIRDEEGRLIGLKARLLDKKYFYFLDSVVKEIKKYGVWYGEHLYFKSPKIAIVEGERDAILLSRYIPSLAIMGTLTEEQIERLRKYKGKILIFFDNDEAGRRMAYKVIETLEGYPLYVIGEYYGCKDPAELVEKELIVKALKTIIKI